MTRLLLISCLCLSRLKSRNLRIFDGCGIQSITGLRSDQWARMSVNEILRLTKGRAVTIKIFDLLWTFKIDPLLLELVLSSRMRIVNERRRQCQHVVAHISA